MAERWGSGALERAFVYAALVHGGQRRKGTEIPYISHLMAVSALVLEAGGTEDQAVAALLHDAAEDHGGETRLADIRERFGDTVADIVRECSDSLAEDPAQKADWCDRKRAYLAHLRVAARQTLLVALADKVHNARAIVRDQQLEGDALFGKFTPGKGDAVKGREATQWYHDELVKVFEARKGELARPAQVLVDELASLAETMRSHGPGPSVP